MARIVILGGGFAAVAAAEILSKGISNQDEITIISASPDFVFYPALVPMVFGDFQPEEIRFDLRPELAKRDIRFVQGEIIAIDPEGRTVKVTGDDVDGVFHFDFLLVAIGRRLATEMVPGFFENAHHLLSVAAALEFKKSIANFQMGAIVVGLAPDALLPVPVCEAALALARKFEKQIKDGSVTISAVFPSTLERAFAGSALFRDIEGDFERKGIRLVMNFAIESISEADLTSSSGSTLPHDLLMLIPPFRGQSPVVRLASVTDESGFARVNRHLQVEGHDGIYAAGDIVSIPGPRFGYMAIRQGKIAALNIIKELSGEEPAAEYVHNIEWTLGERFTDPVFFHYGFWDETLSDFDENAFFGIAARIRERYGPGLKSRPRRLRIQQATIESPASKQSP